MSAIMVIASVEFCNCERAGSHLQRNLSIKMWPLLWKCLKSPSTFLELKIKNKKINFKKKVRLLQHYGKYPECAPVIQGID